MNESNKTPPDTSAAGGCDLWLYFAESHGLSLLESEVNDIRHIVNSALTLDAQRGCAEVAALREQLEQAEFSRDEAYRRECQAQEMHEQAQAALKQMREALRLISDAVPHFQVALSMPAGFPKSKQLPPQGYDVWLHDFIAGVIKIQPDSSALKAVIEAEPEVEALQDGGTCCICDNPITGYDSYGISDKQQHRYHWHCVKREAATVSSPTSEAETAKLREALKVAVEVVAVYSDESQSGKMTHYYAASKLPQISAALAASAQPETSTSKQRI